MSVATGTVGVEVSGSGPSDGMRKDEFAEPSPTAAAACAGVHSPAPSTPRVNGVHAHDSEPCDPGAPSAQPGADRAPCTPSHDQQDPAASASPPYSHQATADTPNGTPPASDATLGDPAAQSPSDPPPDAPTEDPAEPDDPPVPPVSGPGPTSDSAPPAEHGGDSDDEVDDEDEDDEDFGDFCECVAPADTEPPEQATPARTTPVATTPAPQEPQVAPAVSVFPRRDRHVPDPLAPGPSLPRFLKALSHALPRGDPQPTQPQPTNGASHTSPVLQRLAKLSQGPVGLQLPAGKLRPYDVLYHSHNRAVLLQLLGLHAGLHAEPSEVPSHTGSEVSGVATQQADCGAGHAQGAAAGGAPGPPGDDRTAVHSQASLDSNPDAASADGRAAATVGGKGPGPARASSGGGSTDAAENGYSDVVAVQSESTHMEAAPHIVENYVAAGTREPSGDADRAADGACLPVSVASPVRNWGEGGATPNPVGETEGQARARRAAFQRLARKLPDLSFLEDDSVDAVQAGPTAREV